MTARAIVVIGAHFGDEGKGLATDYFCAAAGEQAVAVRFSGGAQAGHTVVTPAGQRHVFHHIGAGTLAGAATFLSRFFIVNPLLWADERAVFPAARVIVDPDAAVTTPYDMLINQELEAWRGSARHGSCGLGINETIERDSRTDHRLRVRDLSDAGELAQRLDAIRMDYVPSRLQEQGCEPSRWLVEMLTSSSLKSSFARHAADFIASVEIDDVDCLRRFSAIVFEGSQGLGLDEHYGRFPHVTRGRTGAIRAVALASAVGITDPELVYVSRAYVTRHGAGPFPNEESSLRYHDDTNVTNQYQGPLRFAPLDIDSTISAVTLDVSETRRTVGRDFVISAMVTCMDQIAQGGRYRFQGNWHTDADALPVRVGAAGPFARVYQSSGRTRHHVKTVERSSFTK